MQTERLSISATRRTMSCAVLVLLFALAPFVHVHGQTDPQKVFNDGVDLLKANEFERAEAKFNEVIAHVPAKPLLKMAYIHKGLSQNGRSKFKEAVSSFTLALKLDPLDPATHTDRGLAYCYQQEYDRAKEDFHAVLNLDSTGKQAQAGLYWLGKVHMITGRNDSAVHYFDKLLVLIPRDAEVYFLRGTAKSNLMDIEGSIADLDKAILLKPDYMEAYANRGFQKVNRTPVKEKTAARIDCLPEPCADLLKAKSLGDDTVSDMIHLYCRKCK